MNIEVIIEENAHHFIQGLKTEYDDDKEAFTIIKNYVENGEMTESDEHILKTQLMDSLKIAGIGIPFVLIPGASVLMPILIKIAVKHNIELLPAAFDDSK